MSGRHILFRSLLITGVALFAGALYRDCADAQEFPFPFTNPSKFFEQQSVEDSDEERHALELIPVSPEEEQKLGREMVTMALHSLEKSGIKTETSGKDVEYLQSLVATLKPLMKNHQRYKTITVILAKSPRIDARSFPAGTLIFFDGLLDAADSEAALAGIVGHELSHLDRGHQLLPIRRQKQMANSLSNVSPSTDMSRWGMDIAKLWSRPFRPEDERAADRDGVRWAHAAGYDSREMAKLFPKEKKQTTDVADQLWAAYFRSHPANRERYDAIMKLSNRLQKQSPTASPLKIGRENLIQRRTFAQENELAK